MKSLARWVVGIGVAASLGAGLYTTLRPVRIQDYVEGHLEEIIKEQEDALGIKHFPERPKLKFEPLEPFEVLYGRGTRAIYTPLDDTLTFYSTETIDDVNALRKMLLHELGHFYEDKLCENLGYAIPEKGPVGLRIVVEGIGEYFMKNSIGESDSFQDSEWSFFQNIKDGDAIPQRIIYEGGYHLVKQIIWQHGPRGIAYLIQNPPDNEGLKDLLAYQANALKALAEAHAMGYIR